MAIYTRGNSYQYAVYSSISELYSKNSELDVCLIDVPIGLSSNNQYRTVDGLMRKELKGRASTVFTTPCRKAAYSETYEAAKNENIAVEGKSLSKQAFCITPKIREVDEFISTNASLEFIEAHPEISFKYLNGGRVLKSRKSETTGIEERLAILEKYNSRTPDLYEKVVRNTLRKHVKRDDVLDAICLSVSLELGMQNLSFLRDENLVDERGIEIKIGYYNPN